MKKLILVLSALICATSTLNAGPAFPGKYMKQQPDGKIVILQRHGDEFYHWTTDENGNVVDRNGLGFYVPASLPTVEECGGREAADRAAAEIRSRRKAKAQTRGTGTEASRYPVLLIQFSDKSFQSPTTVNQDFYNLLDVSGYSVNNSIGSVRDYFQENSLGQFDPVFDVYGPYVYDGLCAENSEQSDAARILWSTIVGHDSEIDWSQYDNDNDGTVDMVFMFYAGWNSAEGEDDTIWPHKWDFYSAGVTVDEYSITKTLDGKRFRTYACSSERGGNSTSDKGMCGIGTFVHEFSHTLGLPDFYDTTYSEGDGQAGANYHYDVMGSGNHNNNGRIPPYYNAEERIMMGWMDGFIELPASGTITLPEISRNVAGRIMSSNTTGDGEYFIFECRSGTRWDTSLEPGLIVYRVDKSTSYSNSYHSKTGAYVGTWTGYDVWNSHRSYINAHGDHPCFHIIPAAAQRSLYYSNEASLPFPGQADIRRFSPQDWAGNTYGFIKNIDFNGQATYQGTPCAVVTMERVSMIRGIYGKVESSTGVAISNASVRIYSPTPPQNEDGPQMISGRIPDRLRAETRTDEQGYYAIDFSALSDQSVDIEIVMAGYVTRYETIPSTNGITNMDFTMRGIQEPISLTLKKFSSAVEGIEAVGLEEPSTTLASIRLTEDDLRPYIGRKILRMGFAFTLGGTGTVSSVYAVVDFGTSRKIEREIASPVPDGWTIVDLSEDNLYIPSGKDCHFGYVLDRCTYGLPLLVSTISPKIGGLDVIPLPIEYASFWRMVGTMWQPVNDEDPLGDLLVYVELAEESIIDYNTIDNPGYGNYRVGDSFALVLNEATGARKPGTAIQWFYDDEPVSGNSVPLKYPGRHVVEARFTTTEGKTKVVELELDVQP